jgi:hypothetical protein
MSSSQGAIAPEVSLCPHLIQSGHTQQPMALYVTARTAKYGCPVCIGDAVERRLDSPNSTPLDAASAVHFNRCHVDGERACWPCLEATSAELVSRWARAFHVDKTKAHALRRVVSHWHQFYDPAGIRCRTITKGAGAAPKKTATEIAADRRDRANATRIANRRAAIREKRRIPETWTLQTKQPEKITVVPPVA